MTKPTCAEIAAVLKKIGFVVFENNYSVNFGGIRTACNVSNEFNDWLYAFYYLHGKIVGVVVPGTTDPGLYYRINPMKKKGTAIIVHNKQYRGVYQLQDPALELQKPKAERDTSIVGHKGKKAFRQIGAMEYWRDDNRDKYLEFSGDIEKGIANTNVHYMGTLGKNVDKWSAGCPGSTVSNMNKIYAIADKQIEMGLGDKFSFTLLTEEFFR